MCLPPSTSRELDGVGLVNREHAEYLPDSLEPPGLATSVGFKEENGSLLELATTFGPPW